MEIGQNAVYLDTKYLNTKLNPIITSANANVSENDVLILWDGSKAGVVYKGTEGVLGSTLKSLKINSGTSSDYVYQVLKNSESIIFDRYRTPNIPHVVKDFTRKFPIQLPTLPEQQKIGALFSKYDAIISLYEQKLAELNALKKGMLQQMFVDGVATSHKPQVRFSGFNDEWVEKKLGEIANLYQPKTIRSGELISTGVPVFGANGYIGYYLMANHDTDQVAISARGANTGSINYVKGPVWITGNSMVVNVDTQPIDKYFLYKMLLSVNFSKYITGGAQPQLTRDVLIKVSISLSTLPEQQKIGQLFKQLDARISNEQCKIEQLKAQKQGLLQKML